jgi:hypothetical protein
MIISTFLLIEQRRGQGRVSPGTVNRRMSHNSLIRLRPAAALAGFTHRPPVAVIEPFMLRPVALVVKLLTTTLKVLVPVMNPAVVVTGLVGTVLIVARDKPLSATTARLSASPGISTWDC